MSSDHPHNKHWREAAKSPGLVDLSSLYEWLSSWPVADDTIPTARITLIAMLDEIKQLRDESHPRLSERLRKEEECHAQTCRLSDEWFAALNEAKRLGLEAVSVAEHEANCSLGIDNLSCDCRVERLRSALESM